MQDSLDVSQAQLIPGECRASFPNLNGGQGRWAVSFVPPNFQYTPAIQACGKPCGRSGFCYQVGGPNERCGPNVRYLAGQCQDRSGNADRPVAAVLADQSFDPRDQPSL